MKESAGKIRILMLVENSFPADTRVRNEAFTLKEAGFQVTVISLRDTKEPFYEEINGVGVYRIPTLTFFSKKIDGNANRLRKLLSLAKAAVGYAAEYFYFTSVCLALSPYIALREGFDVIHAHNPPDTLFVVGAIYKVFGKKFIFDHHDLSPELYCSRFGAQNGIVTKGLLFFEKLSLLTSDVSIATNQSYKEIQMQRGKRPPDKVFIVRNGPDLNRLKPTQTDAGLKSLGKSILFYVGAMNPQDGVDYLLRSLGHLLYQMQRKDFYCVIAGKGDSLDDLKRQAKELGLEEYVWFTGYIPDNDLIRYLSTADICLDPNPSSPLNDHSTWIKVMEYMALGKPIVSFDLKETRYTAQAAALYVKPNDEAEFAQAIGQLMDDPVLRKRMGESGHKRVENELNWQIVSADLLKAYQALP